MNKADFYRVVRAKLGKLTADQVTGIDYILAAAVPSVPLAHAAYMLATAWHETNKTMLPVREAYWLNEAWRKTHLRYYPWYGRGYVQITWDYNYRRADDELGLKGRLVADAELAMVPSIAAAIMRRGMEEGWFTGVKLSAVLPSRSPATREQYMNARTIINGHDKADLIEDYAQAFEAALIEGKWA